MSVKMFKLYNGIKINIKKSEFTIAGEKLSQWLRLFYAIESELVCSGGDIVFECSNCSNEEYCIEISDNAAKIHASQLRGALYGVADFLKMPDKNLEIECFIKSEKPKKGFRGLHTYLPSRENIEEYKKILDLMVFLKMNTVIYQKLLYTLNGWVA